MSTLDILFTALLGAASLALLIFLLHSFLTPFFPALKKMRFQIPKGNIRHWLAKKHLANAKRHIDSGNAELASFHLQKSFFTGGVAIEASAIHFLEKQHNRALELVVELAGIRSVRLSELPSFERSISKQQELLLSLLELRESERDVIGKRKKEGKQVPDWAIQEFEKKKDLLFEELEKNRRDLTRDLRSLFTEISSSGKSTPSQFH